ncbi:MAG TPA: low specificity L-threonine aldolase [Mesorhizobium sp.]
MIFASDNWAGAHPAISSALADAAGGYDPAYGTGELDRKVAARFNEIFEREVAVFFVATGTAANSLALASTTKPGAISFCHREAHVIEDECGAPEYLSGGARLRPVDGRLSKIDPGLLADEIARLQPDNVHGGQASAITITQATEVGTVYSLQEIDAISSIARRHAVSLHMDGARFANALVSLGVTPAEMTWRRGVDMLSFGGTKNGCWCAEAVVLFDPAAAKDFAFYRKRAAQLFSKSRFVAAQFDAYLRDDVWLDTARHANAMAQNLAAAFAASAEARLAWTPQANEVFAIMPAATIGRIKAAGAVFYDWRRPQSFDDILAPDETLCRFVTSFATKPDDVQRFSALLSQSN